MGDHRFVVGCSDTTVHLHETFMACAAAGSKRVADPGPRQAAMGGRVSFSGKTREDIMKRAIRAVLPAYLRGVDRTANAAAAHPHQGRRRNHGDRQRLAAAAAVERHHSSGVAAWSPATFAFDQLASTTPECCACKLGGMDFGTTDFSRLAADDPRFEDAIWPESR
jgi:hypothetical protein